MKNAWKKYGKTTTGVSPVESCLVQSRGVFIQKIRFSPLGTNSEANAAWPDGRMGEAQCDHLGDALMPILYQLRAYKPDGLLVRVQGDALALMSQFSSDRDSLWAGGLYELCVS